MEFTGEKDTLLFTITNSVIGKKEEVRRCEHERYEYW